jgi:predicted P-loop ATPase
MSTQLETLAADAAALESEQGAQVIEIGAAKSLGRKRKSEAEPSPLGLVLSEYGKPKNTVANLAILFVKDDALKGCVGFDEFRHELRALRALPAVEGMPASSVGEWTEGHTTHVIAYIEATYGVSFAPPNVERILERSSRAHATHEVRDYLNLLKWDSVPRAHELFRKYFKCTYEDAQYTERIGKMLLVGAVARVMQPGCKVDTMVVLKGEQGTGKSSAIKALAGNWYTDSPIEFGTKDAVQALLGVWLVEIPELQGMSNRNANEVKSFVSCASDRYRPSYGRKAINVPRQCIFIGTTNEDEFLTDATGNRRFLPVTVMGQIDLEALARDRDQLWAEAVHLYNAGELWYDNSSEFKALAAQVAKGFVTSDFVEVAVADWLRDPCNSNTVNSPDGFSMNDVIKGITPTEADATLPAYSGPGRKTSIGRALAKLGYHTRQVTADGKSGQRRYFKKP